MSEENGMRLGWIGAGRMGFALASRLLEAGHDVAVWNRTRAKAEPLAEQGAAIVDAPADLADRDVVFTMVGAAPAFHRAAFGAGGLLSANGTAPKVPFASTTISPGPPRAVPAAPQNPAPRGP